MITFVAGTIASEQIIATIVSIMAKRRNGAKPAGR
jgi:hypothetical protein